VLRDRFDVIDMLKVSETESFSRAEAAAFHGRKIVEAVAFACLIAIDNGLNAIPRDAKGQWNAEKIFTSLKSKGLDVLPSPSIIRQATPDEVKDGGAKIVIEGIPASRLTHDDLIEIYQRLHVWLHEVNPYVLQGHSSLYAQKGSVMWSDLERLWVFVAKHFISIRGVGFFCVLRDKEDQQTKVIPLSKLND
jgi:hypothetical protein